MERVNLAISVLLGVLGGIVGTAVILCWSMAYLTKALEQPIDHRPSHQFGGWKHEARQRFDAIDRRLDAMDRQIDRFEARAPATSRQT